MTLIRQLFVRPNEYAVLVANQYGDDAPRVEPCFLSERPEKQRAELLRLIATLLDYARADGITIEIEDGKPVVRG